LHPVTSILLLLLLLSLVIIAVSTITIIIIIIIIPRVPSSVNRIENAALRLIYKVLRP